MPATAFLIRCAGRASVAGAAAPGGGARRGCCAGLRRPAGRHQQQVRGSCPTSRIICKPACACPPSPPLLLVWLHPTVALAHSAEQNLPPFPSARCSSAARFLLPRLDRSRFRGVCFFDEGQRQWAVLDLQGRCLPRDCSPIREAQVGRHSTGACMSCAYLQSRREAATRSHIAGGTCAPARAVFSFANDLAHANHLLAS